MINDFIQRFEKNFEKSYSDIMASLKAYSTYGNYTVNDKSKSILFPDSAKATSKDIVGSGIMMHDRMRSRMHNPHKYLL